MSENEKYQKAYLELLFDHDYAVNILHAKTTKPVWRTHIDDELLALAYPCLLMHEKDPEILALYRRSLQQWFAEVKMDESPYFNYTYCALSGNAVQLQVSVDYLRDSPLDLVRWFVDNRKRQDVRLVRTPEVEQIQTYRLLPPGEGGVMRWDNNPWQAVQGDGGYTESDGVYWMLSYWMGRYYGYIVEP